MPGTTSKKLPIRAFAAQVRAARQLVGKTQEELANEAGISPTTIEALEAERSNPYPSTKLKIAEALRRWGITLKDNGEVGAVIERSRLES